MLNGKKKKWILLLSCLKNDLLRLGQQEGNMPAHPIASCWRCCYQSPVMTMLKFGLCTNLALPLKNSWLLTTETVDLFWLIWREQQTYLLSSLSGLCLLKIKLLKTADHLSTDNFISNWLHHYILFVCTVICEGIKFLCLTFTSEPVVLREKGFFFVQALRPYFQYR